MREKLFRTWDGDAPLWPEERDRGIFNEDDLRAYLEAYHESGRPLESIEISICEYDNGPNFDILDVLDDYSDFDPPKGDVLEINRIVNEWIDRHGPYSIETTGVYVLPESLRRWWPDLKTDDKTEAP